MLKIEILGPKNAVRKAETMLKELKETEHVHLEEMDEPKARLVLQGFIDENDIRASILVNGNTVWSRSRILDNLVQIKKHGRLYFKDSDRPRFYPIGSMLRIPEGGKLVLSKYFYEFLHLDCGSMAHYNIFGWVAIYPTLDHLKAFFKKNEFGDRVLDHIPAWHTDARRIVEDIEHMLFPLESLVRDKKQASRKAQ